MYSEEMKGDVSFQRALGGMSAGLTCIEMGAEGKPGIEEGRSHHHDHHRRHHTAHSHRTDGGGDELGGVRTGNYSLVPCCARSYRGCGAGTGHPHALRET